MRWICCFALALAGCSHVPGDKMTTDSSQISTADLHRYDELVLGARGAFLRETRTVEGVQDSHERYKQALALRSDQYEVLWEAARTAVWLANFGPADRSDACVRDGIRYANTALALQPRGEEGLFYDGVLAGKLAELDNSYAIDGLKIIQQRMRDLLAQKSTYIYGGPDRVLATVLMRAPGSPIGPGDWDLAEQHMKRALEIDPNWPENQLYMAELEFGLAGKRGLPELAVQARARLERHFLNDSARAPMGSGFEFAAWQEQARKLIEANK